MRRVMATIGFCSASKEVSTSMSLTCCGSVRSPPVTRRPAAANSSSRRLWASSRRAIATRRTRTAACRRPSAWSSTKSWSSAAHDRLCSGSSSINLDLPVKGKDGETVWRRPNYATIHRMIENPIYGGTYAYGKTAVVAGYDGAGVKVKIRRKARSDWLALMPNAHEGYVRWDKAEAIRKMVSSNVPTSRHHGAPKHGDALLAGLLRCRRCGRKLTLRYSGAKHHIPRYSCTRGWMDNGEPRCIAFGGLRVDDAIEGALLTVVGPGAIAAAVAAEKETRQRRDQVREALRRDLEAARYAADRAFRQYDAADPANRLVTGELEARWNKALARVAEVEAKITGHDAATVPSTADPASFATLAADLKSVWTTPTTDARLKKRIVRTVIHEVIADIDTDAAEIVLLVHWVGGVHTEIRLPRRRRGQRTSTSADVIAAVRQLVLIANDDLIAGILNRNGLVTGYGNRWTRERVTSLRSHHGIAVHKPADDGIEPWLNLNMPRGFFEW